MSASFAACSLEKQAQLYKSRSACAPAPSRARLASERQRSYSSASTTGGRLDSNQQPADCVRRSDQLELQSPGPEL